MNLLGMKIVPHTLARDVRTPSNRARCGADGGAMNTDELRRLAQAATPGEWEQYLYEDHDGPPACDDIGVQASNTDAHALEVLCTMEWSSSHPRDFTRDQATANAAYIAAAHPAAVLALLDDVDRLRAALREAVQQAVEFDGLDTTKLGPQHWHSIARAALGQPEKQP